MNIFQLLADDPSVDPAFKRAMGCAPGIARVGSERWLEVRAQERADHQSDERRTEQFGADHEE